MTKILSMCAATALTATTMLGSSALFASPATAQTTDEQVAQKATQRFAQADTDQDGSVSRDEWKTVGLRDRGFDRVDTDKNERVTLEEMKAAAAKYRSR